MCEKSTDTDRTYTNARDYLFLLLLTLPSPFWVSTEVESLSCSLADGRSKNIRISLAIESCSL